MFSKKATKFEKIFTVDLILITYCQIDSEDFVNFYGLLRKHEPYMKNGRYFLYSNGPKKSISGKDRNFLGYPRPLS